MRNIIVEESIMTQVIYVTNSDRHRLLDLTPGLKGVSPMDDSNLEVLRREIERARIVAEEKIQENIITMNSTFRVRLLDSGEVRLYTLVFPEDADFSKGKISVLSPLGTALIGYQEGDVVRWLAPAGTKKLKVEKILYQPEAAGHYYL
jgi:regulator of nucleoside diphosphate kinase